MFLSIVIPCYNHGAYLPEALASVRNIDTGYQYEIIIIDDGSTDEDTISVLAKLSKDGYKVIRQENQGLAAARNNAIAVAQGQYIIPLDSDNKLHSNYLTKAIDILEKIPSIDVVYGNPQYFGERNEIKAIGILEPGNLFFCNYIDACAVFRKTVWERVGGFDGSMPGMGNEDWEFWIHAFLTGSKFYFLNDLCFYYRVVSNSMSATTTRTKFLQNQDYIYRKHYKGLIKQLVQEQKMLDYIRGNRWKAILKLFAGYKFKNDISHNPEL